MVMRESDTNRVNHDGDGDDPFDTWEKQIEASELRDNEGFLAFFRNVRAEIDRLRKQRAEDLGPDLQKDRR